MPQNDRVTMQDIRAEGYCLPGLRSFCDAHGIDLRQLVREGVPVAELSGIEDANLQKILDKKAAE